MTPPNPVPRKYRMVLEGAMSDLQVIARKARQTLQELEGLRPNLQSRYALREIEAIAYKAAMELSMVQTTDDCDGCPAAPPSQQARLQLLVIADELERQAAFARAHARGNASGFYLEEATVLTRQKGGETPGAA